MEHEISLWLESKEKHNPSDSAITAFSRKRNSYNYDSKKPRMNLAVTRGNIWFYSYLYSFAKRDILVWNEITNCAFELSSMGIRVDEIALIEQAKLTQSQINTSYHEMVINNTIPLSIGGGFGQSRLCMFLLEKKHIGEVQVSEWSDEMIAECDAKGIHLL